MARLSIEDENQVSVASPVSSETFKLLRLPLVALQKVLKSIDLCDIFTLSLCSTRTLNILKFWKSNINFLLYQDIQGDLWVFNRLESDFGWVEKEHIFCAKQDAQVDGQNEMTTVKIGGLNIRCVWKENGIEYTISTSKSDIQVALHSHIQQLFNINDIGFEFSPTLVSNETRPNIPKTIDMLLDSLVIGMDISLRWDRTRIEDIEETIQKYPNLKSLTIHREIDGVVQPHSDIFKVDELTIVKCGPPALTILENFHGKCGYFGELEGFTGKNIIDFVMAWISGQKYLNLEVLELNMCRETLRIVGFGNYQMVLDELRPLSVQLQPPRENIFRKHRIWMANTMMFAALLFEQKTTLVFQRSTDQKMATLILSTAVTQFRVWKDNI